MRVYLFAFSIAALSLLAPEPSRANEQFSCTFVDQNNDTTTSAECGVDRGNGDLSVSVLVREKIKYGQHNLASFYVAKERGCYWLRKNGPARRMICDSANTQAPESFKDGMARTIGIDGKIGYVDTRLFLSVSPRFDFGLPFERSRAKVCVKCKVDVGSVADTMIPTGGSWLIIDKKGQTVKECPRAKSDAECNP